MPAFLLAALVGVVHVHHAPSHDSDGRFEEVVEAAAAAELDFVVFESFAKDLAEACPNFVFAQFRSLGWRLEVVDFLNFYCRGLERFER